MILDLLTRFSGILTTAHTPDTLSQLIVDLAQSAISPCDSAGLMHVERGQVKAGAVSDEVARKADAVQIEVGDGPCMTAMREKRLIVCEDLAHDERFGRTPMLMSEESGARSSMSIPLWVEDESLGALNLYSRTAESFTDVDESIAKIFAVPASASFANVRAYHDVKRLSEQLEQALESRAVIDQAKGILVATEGLTPEDAFDRIRKASQKANIPVREIAASMVEKYSQQSGA